MRYGILAIGAICDKNGANGHPLAPMEMDQMARMAYPIAIGDQWINWNGYIGNIPWQIEDENIQQKLMALMVTDGDTGKVGANGTDDNPFHAAIMIHWLWNAANGGNNS